MAKKSAVAANTRSVRKSVAKQAAVASVSSRNKANKLASTNPGVISPPPKPARN
jgi:hypothetical protein